MRQTSSSSSALLVVFLFSLALSFVGCGGGGGGVPAGGIVEGAVVDATNPSVPIENAYVYIPVSPLASARPEQVIEDFTDSEGSYRLVGVPLDQDLPLIVEPTPQSSLDFARIELSVRATRVGPKLQWAAVISRTIAQQITALGISPETATLQVSQTRQFNGFVTGYPGELRCTWWITGGIGTVSPIGLFTATEEGTGAVHVGLADFEAQAPLTVVAAGTQGRIAFHSNRDGNGEIYVMNPDGSNQTNLANNPADDSYPSWSPDGSKIAFQSDRDGNLDICVMNSDGTNQMNLTNNPASEEWHPAWSPDGSKIVFQSDRDGNFEIYLMNSDGSNQTRLTNNPASDSYASWSPDGSKIAFTSRRDGNQEIYVMNSDGTNQMNLTNNPADDARPRWSPF